MSYSAHLTSLFKTLKAVTTENTPQSFERLLELVDGSTAAHFALDRHAWRTQPYAMKLPINATAKFEMSIFCVPKGRRIPVHDHPHMMVLGKVLHGAMRMRVFRWRKDPAQSHFAGGDAVLSFDGVVTPETELFALDTPARNLHELEALEDAAFFDVMYPPYQEGVRDCHYFKAKPKSGKIYSLEIVQPLDFVCTLGDYLGPRPDTSVFVDQEEA